MLVTIKPIHSLVAAVMKGVGTPELLIQGAQSEHSYALKPSDAEKIGRARIVFEVGPDLETYLVRPLATLAPRADIVVLERAPGVHLLPARRGGLWEDGSDPDDGPTDPHIWLDPENGIAMTKAIAASLIKADPSHADLYAANRDRAESRPSRHSNATLRRRHLAPLRMVAPTSFSTTPIAISSSASDSRRSVR